MKGPRIGSMFSGIDGLALGVQLLTGARVAWHAETDPDASAVLASHWHSPNLGDVSRIDWARVEPIDILVGGFPCQDISLAGKGAGIDGERSGLWRYIVDAIRALRPRFVLVENVAALVARGLDRVLRDLAEIGYDAIWSTLTSAAVGAPHKRERLFILATPDTMRIGHDGSGPRQECAGWPEAVGRGASADADRAGLRDAEQRDARRSDGVRDEGRPELVDDGEAAPNAIGKRRKAEGKQQRKRAVDAQAGADATNADLERRQWLTALDRPSGVMDEQPRNDADGRSAGPVGHTGAIPGGVRKVGARAGARSTAARRLNPDFVEWMMGFPAGWTAMVSRRARLRLLGNAVQPQVAMAAWSGLIARLG